MFVFLVVKEWNTERLKRTSLKFWLKLLFFIGISRCSLEQSEVVSMHSRTDSLERQCEYWIITLPKLRLKCTLNTKRMVQIAREFHITKQVWCSLLTRMRISGKDMNGCIDQTRMRITLLFTATNQKLASLVEDSDFNINISHQLYPKAKLESFLFRIHPSDTSRHGEAFQTRIIVRSHTRMSLLL